MGVGVILPLLSAPLLSAEPIPFPSYVSSPGFQPAFSGDESLRVVGTGFSLVYPQPESPQDSLQGGGPSVCASACAEQRLDGVH